MYLSNTALFDGRDMCRIYYRKYNYMFRPLIMAIFRLRVKNLINSCTRLMWAVYSPHTSSIAAVYSPHKSSIAAVYSPHNSSIAAVYSPHKSSIAAVYSPQKSSTAAY